MKSHFYNILEEFITISLSKFFLKVLGTIQEINKELLEEFLKKSPHSKYKFNRMRPPKTKLSV